MPEIGTKFATVFLAIIVATPPAITALMIEGLRLGQADFKGVSLMVYVRLLLAFIIPPLAVYMQFGIGKHFWINCLLTLLGVVPGIIHAVYIMAARPPGLVPLQEN